MQRASVDIEQVLTTEKAEAHVCKVGETVSANNNPAVLTSSIHNPKLWWPNGYGDQSLYKVQVELLDEDGTVLETITKRIGLRTLPSARKKDLWEKSSRSVSTA